MFGGGSFIGEDLTGVRGGEKISWGMRMQKAYGGSSGV